MLKIADFLNSLVMYPFFGVPFIVLLITFIGVFLTIRFKFLHLIGIFITKSKHKSINKKDEVSGFSAFMAAAGSTLGMGNIVGGAVAVTIGGAGTMFWIVIFSFILSSVKFAETMLGHKYRKEDKDGIISGGAFFYIRRGISAMGYEKFSKYLGYLYAILFSLAYTFAGSFQVNQISSLVSSEIIKFENWNHSYNLYISIPLALFTLFILFGGIKRIGDFSVKAVPFMVFCHLFCSSFIIIKYLHNFDDILIEIIESAFALKSAGGGIFFVIAYSLQRILFASDAGTGAASVANSNSSKKPVEQGFIVAFEPILVAIMMLMSGFVVLLTHSHHFAAEYGLDGIAVVNKAFSMNNGHDSILVLFWINITLFGITSIISDGYYVEKAWYYMMHGKYTSIAKILYCIIAASAAVLPFKIIMPISDATFFLTMIVNSVAIFILSGVIKKDMIEYIKGHRKKV